MTSLEILQQCTVEGTTVKLPAVQLDRKTYQDVAKKLELIGGKWKGGKVAGFVFPEDPSELLSQIANGENRNLKKEYQFFATPDALADRIVALCQVLKGDRVLEPSAGQGAIIDAIVRQYPDMKVECFELMDLNRSILEKHPSAKVLGEDFLTIQQFWDCEDCTFDKIIANPPFSKNQDIDHIMQMYAVLADGGRLVSIASKHWQLSQNRKETEFREWLKKVGATVHEIEAGAFKESGTSISSVIIIIDK